MRTMALLTVLGATALMHAASLPAWAEDNAATKAVEAAKAYSGVTLKSAEEAGLMAMLGINVTGPEWEQLTGIKLQVTEIPFEELFPKQMLEHKAGSGAYDIMTIGPSWVADMVRNGALEPLDPYIEKYGVKAEFDDIAPAFKDWMTFEGKTYALVVDGDVHLLYYRKDVFEDPANKDEFKAKYGYDLAPPKTWDEYIQISEFFQRPDKNLWGNAAAFRRGGQQFWFFFSIAAAYAAHPDVPGGFFFDPETMNAQVNNPGWVKGLETYIKISKLAPPNALNFSFGETIAAHAGGQVAQSFGWGDTGVVAADKKQSKVAGTVGSAILPGSKEVYNTKTKSWVKFDEPLRSPFMAFGGWQAAVPSTSKAQEAAWNFIELMSSPEVSGQAAITGGTGVNPYRASHTTNLKLWANLFSEREAKEYLASQADSLSAKNVVLDMRLPGYFSYTEVLEIELSKALAGQVTPQAALDTVAKEWNRLTDEFGRDKQLKAYRAAMGLPAK